MDRFSQILIKHKRQFEQKLRQLLPDSTSEQRQLIIKRLSERKRAEEEKPPKIAIIGQAGAGKSSTINALFGTSLPVGHVGACTTEEAELRVEAQTVDGANGVITVFDMPGLGDDPDLDCAEYKQLYNQVLSECDVAVWVINAASRAMGYDKQMIRDVVAPSQDQLTSRLVIGLNQVDLMQPGSWFHRANLPSKSQKETIAKRLEYIIELFRDIVPGIDVSRIIPYSAMRGYHLEQLFEAMLNACDSDRAWVLYGRKSIEDFAATIDPDLLR